MSSENTKASSKEQNEIKEISPKRKKHNKKLFLLYIAAFVFVAYASFTIISQGIEIGSKKSELDSLNEQLQIVEINNEYLKEIKNYSGDELKEYIENIARQDLDYVKDGERIFINISGD